MLEKLGALYVQASQWTGSLSVHRALQQANPMHSKVCAWQQEILQATAKATTKTKSKSAALSNEIKRTRELVTAFDASDHPAALKEQCRSQAALLIHALSD